MTGGKGAYPLLASKNRSSSLCEPPCWSKLLFMMYNNDGSSYFAPTLTSVNFCARQLPATFLDGCSLEMMFLYVPMEHGISKNKNWLRWIPAGCSSVETWPKMCESLAAWRRMWQVGSKSHVRLPETCHFLTACRVVMAAQIKDFFLSNGSIIIII